MTIRQCGFKQFAAAGDGAADLITMVAVLHHLGLDDTLARIPGRWHQAAACSSLAWPG